MTERKPLREQMASQVYSRREPLQDEHEPMHTPYRREGREPQEVRAAPRKLQRVVSIPEYDLSSAGNTFARRQEHLRRTRSRPQHYVNPVARAHSQTITQAVPPLARRSLPSYHSSPIPVRGGRQNTHGNARRHGLIWKLLGFFSVALVMAFAAGFAFTGNAFRIKQVNVAGTRNNALLHDIQRMGIQGQNIFSIDLTAFAEKVDRYPSVASASISKQWPDQVTVTVLERTPVVLWKTPQGTFSIDGQGMVISAASETLRNDLTKTVVDTRKQGNGQKVQPGVRLPAADIAFAVNVFNRAQEVVGNTAFTLRYDGTMYLNAADHKGTTGSSGSFVIESSAGWIAYIGDAGDTNPLDNRLIELQHILALAQQQELQLATIDVRYGLHPVYTLK